MCAVRTWSCWMLSCRPFCWIKTLGGVSILSASTAADLNNVPERLILKKESTHPSQVQCCILALLRPATRSNWPPVTGAARQIHSIQYVWPRSFSCPRTLNSELQQTMLNDHVLVQNAVLLPFSPSYQVLLFCPLFYYFRFIFTHLCNSYPIFIILFYCIRFIFSVFSFYFLYRTLWSCVLEKCCTERFFLLLLSKEIPPNPNYSFTTSCLNTCLNFMISCDSFTHRLP